MWEAPATLLPVHHRRSRRGRSWRKRRWRSWRTWANVWRGKGGWASGSAPDGMTAAPADPGPAAGVLRLELAHEVPGRLRARCADLREQPELAPALEALARELPGFESVAVRPLTGSVVFQYSLEETTPR